MPMIVFSDMEDIGSADDCFEINDRASETSYGSGNSTQDHEKVMNELFCFIGAIAA